MGRQEKGSRELSRTAQQEVEALPARDALPWYVSMAGPAMNGTQAQPRVRITSHVHSNEVGPRSSQEVDPMGQDPGQQGTQWVTLPGTRLSCNAPTTQLGRLSPQLESCSKIKAGEHTSWQGCTGEAAQGHPPSSSQMYPGKLKLLQQLPLMRGLALSKDS